MASNDTSDDNKLSQKGTGHDFFWSRTPMNHFQKQEKLQLNHKKQQNPSKIAEIMKKIGLLASFNLGGAQSSVFNFLKSQFYYVWYV